MATGPAAPVPDAKKSRRFRIVVLAGVLVVVFLAGIGVGVLLEETALPFVQVTTNVSLIGSSAGSVWSSSSCSGGSQQSFNGYFSCSVYVVCRQTGPGNYIINNASAPGASDFVVTPALPQNLACNSSDTLQVSGQLGYSGSVTVYLDVE